MAIVLHVGSRALAFDWSKLNKKQLENQINLYSVKFRYILDYIVSCFI